MNPLNSSNRTPAQDANFVPPIPEADKTITALVNEKGGVCLHGERVKCGTTVKITLQQWQALSRFFRFIDGPAEHAPATWEPKTLVG